jgi:pyrroloquinoline quinone biosynthesis protein D
MSMPLLVQGARLTYDRVRHRHVVLFPEGVLVPNRTALAVLELCDGTSSVADIVRALRERFTDVRQHDVIDVLDRLADRRVIQWI